MGYPQKRSDDVLQDRFCSNAKELIFEDRDKVIKVLNALNDENSNDLEDIVRVQKEELKDNPLYKAAWDVATKIYEGVKREYLSKMYSKAYHIALIAYTLEKDDIDKSTAMYMDFNAKTRQLKLIKVTTQSKQIKEIVDPKYKYVSLFKLLFASMKFTGDPADIPDTLYRGVSAAFTKEIGDVFIFGQFVSTSVSKKGAENFAACTMFKFDKVNNVNGIGLVKHSLYDEVEILLTPMQEYKIVNREKIESKNKTYTCITIEPFNKPVDKPVSWYSWLFG